jgi:hypothetical protein
MPPTFERRFIDPKAAEVAAALAEAVKQVNNRMQKGLLHVDAAELKTAVRACLSKPEGVRRWVDEASRGAFLRGAGRISLAGLAWWTDPLRRRHVAVVGRRTEHNNLLKTLFGPRDEERPALWLLYPERLFLRTRGRKCELLAVCACGAAGTPAALGWRGQRCGPCHDREEEGLSPVVAFPHPGMLAAHPAAVLAVGFSPDGATLVSASPDWLARWGETDPGCVLFSDSGSLEEKKRASVSFPHADDGRPGGRIPLACAGGRVVVGIYGGMEVRDAVGEPLAEYDVDAWDEAPACAALSADGNTLALALTEGAVYLYDLRALSGPKRPARLKATQTRTLEASGLAFAPDGKTLAVGAGADGVHLIPVGGKRGRQLPVPPEQSVRPVAFDPGGSRLAAGTAPTDGGEEGASGPREGGERVLLWELSAKDPRPTPLQGHAGAVYAVAFSPDGKFVVSTGADRTVKFWDLSAGKEAAALEWHVAPINALVFSPDGQTLATASDDGTVKLWPWRLLLEA